MVGFGGPPGAAAALIRMGNLLTFRLELRRCVKVRSTSGQSSAGPETGTWAAIVKAAVHGGAAITAVH